MKAHEESVAKQIEDQQMKSKSPKMQHQKAEMQQLGKGKNTPYPKDDARPNPYLALDYDDLN